MVQGVAQHATEVTPLGAAVSGITPRIDQRTVDVRLLAGIGVVERQFLRAAAPHRINRRVVRNPEDPVRELESRVERPEVGEHLEEDVLRQLLGQRRVSKHPRQQVVDAALVTVDEGLKAIVEPGQRSFHQLCVSHGRSQLPVNRTS